MFVNPEASEPNKKLTFFEKLQNTICEKIVRKKILRLNCDELNAIAEPTKTGVIDADNVLGLIAMKTDFKKDVIKVNEEIS